LLATVYQLSTINFTWTRFISNDNSSEKVMTLIVDSCGYRLWTLMLQTKYIWHLSSTLRNVYELYFIDLTMNQLVHYGLSLKQQWNINWVSNSDIYLIDKYFFFRKNENLLQINKRKKNLVEIQFSW